MAPKPLRVSLAKAMRGLGLGAAVEKLLTNRRPDTGERGTQAQAREVVDAHGGSTRAAAQALGVSIRTIQKWVTGSQEAKNTARANNADRLAQAVRESRVKQGRAERLSASATGYSIGGGGRYAPTGGNQLRIKGTFRVSNDTRTRTIDAGGWLAPGALDNVVSVFVTEGRDAAGLILEDVLQDYVEGMEVLDIHWIEV